ncbi:alpha-D-kanosaminyltransferase [bacterium BMS3Abin01]|nr:alpha-D-kanosaminyltransferase [bacterium BMS3Abin01]
MKIINVIANARQGGMPEHVLTLSRELKQRGHQVQVLSMTAGPMVQALERAGINTVTVPRLSHRMGKNPLLAVKVTRITRGLLQHMDPDIIHTHGPRAHILAGRASRYPGGHSLVATVHGSYRQFMAGNGGEFSRVTRRLKQLQYLGIDRYTAGIADRVIAVSDATRDDLVKGAGVPADKVCVIHNGVARQQVSDEEIAAVRGGLGLGDARKLVAYVGRMAFHKGAGDLVSAAAAVARQAPGARMVMVGEGPLSDELKEGVAAEGLRDRVMFTGHREDAVSIIAASDLFVLPSLSEGLALTLLEAAMTSTAMIATDVGGNPDVVRPGETGLLVPPRDPEALAAAIVDLLRDDSRRAEMGAAARRLWEREFTVGRMVDSIEALYGELTADRRND